MQRHHPVVKNLLHTIVIEAVIVARLSFILDGLWFVSTRLPLFSDSALLGRPSLCAIHLRDLLEMLPLP